MELSDRIRAARVRRKLTQAQLAELVGVQATAVVHWEDKKNRRHISGPHLRKVAEVLGVTVSSLLGEGEVPISLNHSRVSNMTITHAEKTLLELFRSFPQELQLLQLANFVECAKLRKIGQFAGHEAGDGLPVDAAANG